MCQLSGRVFVERLGHSPPYDAGMRHEPGSDRGDFGSFEELGRSLKGFISETSLSLVHCVPGHSCSHVVREDLVEMQTPSPGGKTMF